MSTSILWPWDLPEYIDGTAVICDVWAATTNISMLLTKGVKSLFLVNSDNVHEAKKLYADAVVIGESNILLKEFFYASNYLFDVFNANVEGKTVLFMSKNGSRVVELALKKKAHTVLTVSFANITSVVHFLEKNQGTIYLIPAGERGKSNPKVIEDIACVESLQMLLKGEIVNLEEQQSIAEEFIRNTYTDKNVEGSFDLLRKINSADVIPICRLEKEGWISVKDGRKK